MSTVTTSTPKVAATPALAATRQGFMSRVNFGTIGLVVYLVLLMLPIYWMLNMSLRPNADILRNFTLVPTDITFANYAKIFTDRSWYMGYVNSLSHVLLNTAISLASCELFDPVTDTFSAAGSMGVPRAGQEALPPRPVGLWGVARGGEGEVLALGAGREARHGGARFGARRQRQVAGVGVEHQPVVVGALAGGAPERRVEHLVDELGEVDHHRGLGVQSEIRDGEAESHPSEAIYPEMWRAPSPPPQDPPATPRVVQRLGARERDEGTPLFLGTGGVDRALDPC